MKLLKLAIPFIIRFPIIVILSISFLYPTGQVLDKVNGYIYILGICLTVISSLMVVICGIGYISEADCSCTNPLPALFEEVNETPCGLSKMDIPLIITITIALSCNDHKYIAISVFILWMFAFYIYFVNLRLAK